ncbi:MAG: 6-phosphogluconolactonase [Lentisphaerota bacterium]
MTSRNAAQDMQTEIHRFNTLHDAQESLARRMISLAQDAVKRAGAFRVALSGGKTPAGLFNLLAGAPWADQMPWEAAHWFWADERAVPADDPASNMGLVQRLLFSRVRAPAKQIHPLCPSGVALETAARNYEDILRKNVPLNEQGIPSLDLVLLGIGDDGHTASLFPGDEALDCADRWIVAVPRPKGRPPVPRLTMTLPLINAARTAVFLVSGDGKRDVIRRILSDPESSAKKYPAARVRPAETLVWMLDSQAV